MECGHRTSDWVEASLRAGRTATLRVVGASMAPALRPGDRLVVEPLGGAPPATGEIVVFRLGGRLCVHRVVAHAGDGVITRGDARREDDPPAGRDALVGRVTRVAPRGWIGRGLSRLARIWGEER